MPKTKNQLENEIAADALRWRTWWTRFRRAVTALEKIDRRLSRLSRQLTQVAAADQAAAAERLAARKRRAAENRRREDSDDGCTD